MSCEGFYPAVDERTDALADSTRPPRANGARSWAWTCRWLAHSSSQCEPWASPAGTRRPTQMCGCGHDVPPRCRPRRRPPDGSVWLPQPAHASAGSRLASQPLQLGSSSAERLGVSHMADTVLVCMSRCLDVHGSLADSWDRHHLKRVICLLARSREQDARLAADHLFWAMPAPPREARVASSGLSGGGVQPGGRHDRFQRDASLIRRRTSSKAGSGRSSSSTACPERDRRDGVRPLDLVHALNVYLKGFAGALDVTPPQGFPGGGERPTTNPHVLGLWDSASLFLTANADTVYCNRLVIHGRGRWAWRRLRRRWNIR